ncbi:ankyrin repeat domain-containing protein 13C-like [Senna tora]|uniref:Ankyrin repeat domain-containing protein 13C-like n=1 Tax=Senna tora TaxID=362788 RepID=A0A834X2V0_9FABA|nr:ankyrin repeat domain-containing protein 13C-like [Senna tora]
MADTDVSEYSHSPVHKAIVLKDYDGLKQILAGLPQLKNAFEIRSEAESIAEENKASAISAVVDFRDVPNRDTPLHLAAKLGDEKATEMLMVAGANKNMKNKQGWSPLTEAIMNKQEKVGMIMIRHSDRHVEEKSYRRLPRYVAAMRRMRDFYMEITFHFESSVIPFISRIAPSDTYKIWKRGGNMRADMTLAGFDGLKIKRSDRSIFFLGDGLEDGKKPPGPLPLCVVSHKDKKVNTSPTPGNEPSDRELRQRYNKKARNSAVNVGIDVSQAYLVPQVTWRRKERKEMVGPWKAKVYDMHNVNISVITKRNPAAKTDHNSCSTENNKRDSKEELQEILTEEERKQLEDALAQNMDSLDSNNEDEFDKKSGDKKDKKGRGRKEKDKDKDKEKKKGKHSKAPSVDSASTGSGFEKEEILENGVKRGMRPTLWLTPDFPLDIEELLPLLDILADKVKAVRRLRELINTRVPKGIFPVKVGIPVVPFVRVLISFTKFEELPQDEFSSAPSSPASSDQEEEEEEDPSESQSSSSSWFQWKKTRPSSSSDSKADELQDLFYIPSDYTWISGDEKKNRKKTEKT